MIRLFRLLLLVLVVAVTTPAPAHEPLQPAAHMEHDHHGRGQKAPPADHPPGHVCVGCALPLREPLAETAELRFMAAHGPASVDPLHGRFLTLDPPPPKRRA